MSLLCRLKNLVHKGILKAEDLDRIVIIPKGQEPCEDCISRAQALSDYADWYGYGYRDNTFYKRLKDMSPVTPKPKTDVLDKIMKEIKEIYADIDDVCIKNGLNLARRIINKYKAESEDKE